MTTPSYSELVTAVRREGEALVAASRQGPDEPVPTCPDWTVADLAQHVAGVYTWAGTIAHERLTGPPTELKLPDGETSVDVLAEALEDLVEALRSCDADTPMWNWGGGDQVATFWARRMAHESAVHRFDAQRAHGLAQPIDADLAHDGIDELVDVVLPGLAKRDGRPLPTGTYLFVSTDDGNWAVQTGADGIRRLDAAKEPDVTVRGTASALLLAATNRVPWTSLEVEGQADLLDAWSTAFTF
jgi:uncharacterized protein (TIGR03083 family)